MWQHGSEVPSRPNNTPRYVHTTFCLPTNPSVDTWVASTFWLLCHVTSSMVFSLVFAKIFIIYASFFNDDM